MQAPSRPSPQTAATQRRTALAKIHVAIKQLGITPDDHRALLRQVCGVASSKDLDARGLDTYLAHLRKLGFKAKPAKPGQSRALDTSPQMRKARAVWLMLHAIGVVKDPSERALVAYGRRVGGVDALQWQRRPDALVEGLKAWAMRHLPVWVDMRIKALGGYKAVAGGCAGRPLACAVAALIDARQRGVAALFDYYWPLWEALSNTASVAGVAGEGRT